MASNTLKLAFVLSATDKMSRIVDEAVKKSTDKLSAFERTTGKVGRSMMKVGTVMVGAGAAIGGAMLGMAKSTADYGNQAAKTARSVGMGAEEWQKLAYAAKYAGVEEQKLSAAMVRFNKNVVDAASGSGNMAQTFKDLGISVKDSAGNLREPNDILADVADVFANTQDGAAKTALAYELLGRSGADMVSLLNGGSEGLEAMGKEAESMGLVMTDSATKASEDFVDNLDRVKDSMKGVVFQLGSSLMPAINDLAVKIKEAINKVTTWIKENPKLAETIGKVGMFLSGLLLTVGTASVLIGGVTFVVGQFGKVFRAVSTAIKVGTAIVNACKNGMLLFRIQYAALVVWQKLAAVAQWLFNASMYGCPVVWIVAAIAAIIAAVVLMVKNWDKITAFFSQLWEKIKNIFGKVWEWIKNMFLNYTPYGLIIKHWDTISAFFVGLWGKVKGAFGAAWEWIKNMFLKYHPIGILISHWDKISAWFSQMWDRIKGVFSGGWQTIADFFSGLPAQAFEWGKNILMGLWNGITSLVSKLVDGVKNIGKKIAGGFKSFFGINSPSKLFAEYGVNLTQGLVVGMDQGGSAVENATGGMAAAATSGINQSMQSSSVSATSIMNGGSTSAALNYAPQITINGNASQDTLSEFDKLLRKHANEIISIVRRDAENTARLSFNT